MNYRVGLIGTGPKDRTVERGGGFAIGRVHADSWCNVEGASLVAACDINADNLEAFAEDYGVEERYLDYHDMLAEAKLDVVDICTWPPLHCEMVIAAARAGIKAIYCEKPMCLSLGEAKQMVRTCQESGAKLSISHQRRFEPRFQKAKAWVASGKIGKVLEIHGRIGGADADLLSWGTHWFDMFNYFLDDAQAESVFAQVDCSGTIRYGHPVEDRSLVHVLYQNGVSCYLEGYADAAPIGLRIIGSQGLIQLGSDLQGWSDDGSSFPQAEPGASQESPNAFSLAMTDLLMSVEENREPLLSGELACRTTELIMAAYESATHSSAVKLPLDTEEFPLWSRPEFRS